MGIYTVLRFEVYAIKQLPVIAYQMNIGGAACKQNIRLVDTGAGWHC